MSREMSTLKGEENLTGQVSFLRSKLVCQVGDKFWFIFE